MTTNKLLDSVKERLDQENARLQHVGCAMHYLFRGMSGPERVEFMREYCPKCGEHTPTNFVPAEKHVCL